MSRIGKAPISIPQGVTITIKENIVTVKGKLGELTQVVKDVAVKQEDGQLIVERQLDTKQGNALHGLYRALLHNMVVGVSEGFTKELELVGVGYRATNQGQRLDLALGFSHNILMELPQEVKVETINEKGKNPIIKLTSHDKQLLGQVAAKIRSFRKPEPYKGKGVRFVGENVRRNASKLGFKNITVEKVESDRYDTGKVVSQNIPAGTEIVPKEKELIIQVSSGKKKVSMPNLVGEESSRAESVIASYGFKNVSYKEEYSDKEAGTVISQSIRSGSSIIPSEESLEIIISKGKEKKTSRDDSDTDPRTNNDNNSNNSSSRNTNSSTNVNNNDRRDNS